MAKQSVGNPLVTVAGFLIAMVGGIFAFLGIGFGLWGSVIRSGSVLAEGTVVQVELRTGGIGKSGYVPVISYRAGEREYVCRALVSGGAQDFRVGDKVPLSYKADAPETAYLNTFRDRWLLPLVFGCVGGVLFLAGLGAFWRHYRRSAPRQRSG